MGCSMSDDDKIRLQIYLDVQQMILQVKQTFAHSDS